MAIYTTLIGPETAADDTFSGKFLDCRARLGDSSWGLAAYRAGHIDAAGYLSLDNDLADPPGPAGRHPLPDPERLAARLRALGLNDEDQVVVYDDAGGAFAARAWWCLRWLGHAPVALLDGGIDAWPRPLSDAIARPPNGNFSIRPALTRTVDATALCGDPQRYRLLDARAHERFRGEVEPIDPVAGHIPGATCLPFQDNLDDRGRFRPAAELRARFPATGDAVCYCGSGVTAAHNVLAMCHAGLPEPALYPGSWSEWICDPSRPRASGP